MKISVDKLKKLRLHSGWSQERLADISGLSLRTIQRIESGGSASLESQLAIATAFDISPSELIDNVDIEVGQGGINWSGLCGVAICCVLMVMQLKLGAAPFFDYTSVILVFGLSFAMATISFGFENALTTLASMRWVVILPKQQLGIQQHIPNLNNYINYCHIAGAISTLVGIIAVMMTPESLVYNYAPAARYPFAMGIGIALLTTLYAAMFAELILRPLKHQIERLLIQRISKN